MVTGLILQSSAGARDPLAHELPTGLTAGITQPHSAHACAPNDSMRAPLVCCDYL